MSKTLERIAGLLAKAESTEFEAERESLMSKAQHIASISGVELEVARRHQRNRDKRAAPIQKRIAFWAWPNSGPKQGRAHYVNLFQTIARNNDVEIDIFSNSTGVIAFGFESDIEVCEALWNSLSVQMVTTAEAYLKTKSYRNETVRVFNESEWRYVDKPVDGRTARQSFYSGFVNRIGVRLAEARVAALATVNEQKHRIDGAETSTELVLVGKRDEVRSFHKSASKARGTWRGGGSAATSYTALGAGHKAGERAALSGGTSLPGGRKQLA